MTFTFTGFSGYTNYLDLEHTEASFSKQFGQWHISLFAKSSYNRAVLAEKKKRKKKPLQK